MTAADPTVDDASPPAASPAAAWAEACGRVMREQGVRPFIKPDAPWLLLAAADLSTLGANEAGAALARAGFPPATARKLADLAHHLAPLNGLRLEQLALSLAAPEERVVCACRRLRLGEETALLVAAQQPVRLPEAPPPPADPTPDAADNAAEEQAVADEATAPGAPFDPAAWPARQRFVWEADRAGRLTALPPLIAALFGPGLAAALAEQGWAGALGRFVSDDNAAVADALAGEATWNGRKSLWRLGSTDSALPVTLSATPLQRPDRGISGWRGFGIIHTRTPEPFVVPEVLAEAEPETESETQAEVAAEPEAAALADAPPALAPGEAAFTTETVTPAESEADPEQGLDPALGPAVDPEAAPPAEAADAAPTLVEEEPPRLSAEATLTAASAADDPAPPPAPPSLTDNVVALPPSEPPPRLSNNERNAFREIAKALGARLEGDGAERDVGADVEPAPAPPARPMQEPARIVPLPLPTPAAQAAAAATPAAQISAAPPLETSFAQLVERLPVGVLVLREERIVYANRTLIELLDYPDLDGLCDAGTARIFPPQGAEGGSSAFTLIRRDGGLELVDARLSALQWQGHPATVMSFRRAQEAVDRARVEALKLDLAKADGKTRELSAILDTATDGVATMDARGRILSLNRSAEALFGYDQREVTGENFTLLLAPESHVTALDYLDGLKGGGVASLLNDGREVIGRVRQGGRIPLFMTMGAVGQGEDAIYSAVLRDMTAWKRAEADLIEAKKTAERASAQKSDVLAKISHEIRTPLNAIIGFTEVMSEERFGPIGNERYKEYLSDIRDSGGYLISLINDLLDLAKIEAGRMDLTFTGVNLNEVAAAAVQLLQPEAGRQRVVLRTGLQPRLPAVVADERSVRQIVINLLSNAVKFTDAGGQVILSTALGDRGEVILRVRDTGVGMTDKELALAMEPFRQVSATRRGGGTGLGLPITKALVEANKGQLTISSAKNEGTLVEITFPPQRVLAS